MRGISTVAPAVIWFATWLSLSTAVPILKSQLAVMQDWERVWNVTFVSSALQEGLDCPLTFSSSCTHGICCNDNGMISVLSLAVLTPMDPQPFDRPVTGSLPGSISKLTELIDL
ncbi:unnamed protein product [Closterium sp. NIES-54]